MADPKSPQSQSITGSSISGSQIAMAQAQGGKVQQVQQGNQSTDSSEKQLTVEEVITLLSKIEELLKESDLSAEQIEKAKKYLDIVKDEVQEKELDKNHTAKNLKKVADVLKSTNEAAESGKGLWEKAVPILGQLAGWFNVAKAFWGLL